ncbi:hypothetical protein Tco_0278079 [Tanacetum coccineum]
MKFFECRNSNFYPLADSFPMVILPINFNSGLVVPVFQKGDDPIDAINHMMSFLTAVVTSREDKLLMLLEQRENTYLEQVEATQGNNGLSSVIIAKGRVIIASSVLSLRGLLDIPNLLRLSSPQCCISADDLDAETTDSDETKLSQDWSHGELLESETQHEPVQNSSLLSTRCPDIIYAILKMVVEFPDSSRLTISIADKLNPDRQIIRTFMKGSNTNFQDFRTLITRTSFSKPFKKGRACRSRSHKATQDGRFKKMSDEIDAGL